MSSHIVEVEHLLRNAQEALETGELNLAHERYAGAINRAYYAMFYAASGILLTKGIVSKPHTNVLFLFRQHFIKSDLIEIEYSDIYGSAMNTRTENDYDMLFDNTQADAKEMLASAQCFVARIADYLSEMEDIQV